MLENKTSNENESERHHQLHQVCMAGSERDAFYKNSVFVRFYELSLFPVVFSSLFPSLFAPARKAIIKLWCFLSYWTSFSDSTLPTLPLDPDLEIRVGEGGLGAFRPQFGLKIRGVRWVPLAPPLDLPLQELFPVIHLLFSLTLSPRLSKADNDCCPSGMYLR